MLPLPPGPMLSHKGWLAALGGQRSMNHQLCPWLSTSLALQILQIFSGQLSRWSHLTCVVHDCSVRFTQLEPSMLPCAIMARMAALQLHIATPEEGSLVPGQRSAAYEQPQGLLGLQLGVQCSYVVACFPCCR